MIRRFLKLDHNEPDLYLNDFIDAAFFGAFGFSCATRDGESVLSVFSPILKPRQNSSVGTLVVFCMIIVADCFASDVFVEQRRIPALRLVMNGEKKNN